MVQYSFSRQSVRVASHELICDVLNCVYGTVYGIVLDCNCHESSSSTSLLLFIFISLCLIWWMLCSVLIDKQINISRVFTHFPGFFFDFPFVTSFCHFLFLCDFSSIVLFATNRQMTMVSWHIYAKRASSFFEFFLCTHFVSFQC